MNTVEKLGKFWNKRKYWQKGGIIGFLIGLIPLLSTVLHFNSLLNLFLSSISLPTTNFALSLFLYLIIGLSLGTIVGFILEGIDKRRPFLHLSNTKKFSYICFFTLFVPLFLGELVLSLIVFVFILTGPVSGMWGSFEFSGGILVLLNIALIPFIGVVSLFSLFFGLLLDLLKKYKLFNWGAVMIYFLILVVFLLIVYQFLIFLLSTIGALVIGG